MVTAREASLKALVKAEANKTYINLSLPAFLKDTPPREKPFARNIAYGTIQHLNTIDWVLSLYLTRSLHTLTPMIRNLLRSATYQILYLDNVPLPVTVDESVKLSYRYGHKGVARLVNAVLRKVSSQKQNLPWPDSDKESSLHISLVYSFPLWLVKRWINNLGIEDTIKLCRANNTVPPVIIRTNTLKTDREQLKGILKKEGLESEEITGLPEALKISTNPEISLSELDSYRRGLFIIQGELSILTGRLMNPRSGKTFIDLCSAPGGKTTHVAQLMNNDGIIKAGDINSARVKLVDKSAERLGVDIIQTRVWDGREIGKLEKPADYVLCDAPCSGLGVINRKPDLKWHKSEDQIHQLSKLQIQLLSAASHAVKPGGKLLYSVCTNEPEETSKVIDSFLKEHPSFHPLPSSDSCIQEVLSEENIPGIWNFYPHIHGKDGFFMTLLERKNY